jgi:cobalt-zinc-cadmium efflux system outer membrane protein
MDIEIARAELELERSLNALTFVIGATVPVEASQLTEPEGMPPAVDAAGIAAMIGRHPDVIAASARVERARQVTALERARRIPDPIVSAGYKRTNGLDSAVAGVSLNIPLFEKNGSAAAKALGEELAVAAEREALAGRLASDAATLVAAAQALAERSARADAELLRPADAVRNAALASFSEGHTDVLRLLDAERVYGDVRRTILELRLDALAAALEARFALGQEMTP